MYSIEFNAVSDNGVIKLPTKYSKLKGKFRVALQLKNFRNTKRKKASFCAVKIETKNFKFDRDEANER